MAQQAVPEDYSEPLNKKETTTVQQVVGTLLFYTHAIDSTMLTAINKIASKQNNGTANTAKKSHTYQIIVLPILTQFYVTAQVT